MDKTTQLENRIAELEKKLNSIFSISSFPLELENVLINRGFQNIGEKELTVYYEAGAGGNAFTEKYHPTRLRNKTEYYEYKSGLKQFTVNTTTNVCYSTNHGFIDGQYLALRSTGSLPAGLDSLVDTYTVINATQNTFQATTDGVNPVDITDSGSGEQYAYIF